MVFTLKAKFLGFPSEGKKFRKINLSNPKVHCNNQEAFNSRHSRTSFMIGPAVVLLNRKSSSLMMTEASSGFDGFPAAQKQRMRMIVRFNWNRQKAII
jgi:hypothetical protein